VNGVIGDLLPLAVAVAISPVPIIAVILMLLSPRAGGTSVGFLVGWVVGVVLGMTVLLLVAEAVGFDTSDGPSTTSSWIKLVLGVLLLLLGVRQWRSRPAKGADVALPKWMAAIDHVTPAKAAGLGLLLSTVNPKNLLMIIGAATTVADANLSTGDDVIAVAVFSVIACCTVAVPVVAYLAARERMAPVLDELRVWLEANNVAVMSVLLLVIGVTLLGKGIGGVG
jgi:threonine/homoserine/homoserine lactone efflux protein